MFSQEEGRHTKDALNMHPYMTPNSITDWTLGKTTAVREQPFKLHNLGNEQGAELLFLHVKHWIIRGLEIRDRTKTLLLGAGFLKWPDGDRNHLAADMWTD